RRGVPLRDRIGIVEHNGAERILDEYLQPARQLERNFYTFRLRVPLQSERRNSVIQQLALAGHLADRSEEVERAPFADPQLIGPAAGRLSLESIRILLRPALRPYREAEIGGQRIQRQFTRIVDPNGIRPMRFVNCAAQE